MSRSPEPRRVALPDSERLSRVGVLRLGETYASPTDANPSRLLPRKLDYFRVDPDDGTTLPEAAASFAEFYGPEPKRLRVAIPGDSPEDVLRGAWRQYGTGKLKIQCDGTTCEERTDTGGWVTAPCVCKSRQIPETDKRNHCQLTYALELILPDVEGVGIWSVSTGSEISIRNLTADLRIVHELNGTLRNVPFMLELVETKVAPEGKATTVYTLRARVVGVTPGALMAGAYRPSGTDFHQLGGTDVFRLPDPLDDAKPDPLLTLAAGAPDAATSESPILPSQAGGAEEPAAGTFPNETGGPDVEKPSQDDVDLASATSGAATEAAAPLWQIVEQQMDSLTSHETARLAKLCKRDGITPTRDGMIAAWGEDARDLRSIMETVAT